MDFKTLTPAHLPRRRLWPRVVTAFAGILAAVFLSAGVAHADGLSDVDSSAEPAVDVSVTSFTPDLVVDVEKAATTGWTTIDGTRIG